MRQDSQLATRGQEATRSRRLRNHWRVETSLKRADTHQSKARWGSPLSVPLFECTRSGSGGPAHWTDQLRYRKTLVRCYICMYFLQLEELHKTLNHHILSLLRDSWDYDLTGAPLRGQEESIRGMYWHNSWQTDSLLEVAYVSHLWGATMPWAQRPCHDVRTGAIVLWQTKGQVWAGEWNERVGRCGGPPGVLAFTVNKL